MILIRSFSFDLRLYSHAVLTMFRTYPSSPLSKDETIVVSTAWNNSYELTPLSKVETGHGGFSNSPSTNVYTFCCIDVVTKYRFFFLRSTNVKTKHK